MYGVSTGPRGSRRVRDRDRNRRARRPRRDDRCEGAQQIADLSLLLGDFRLGDAASARRRWGDRVVEVLVVRVLPRHFVVSCGSRPGVGPGLEEMLRGLRRAERRWSHAPCAERLGVGRAARRAAPIPVGRGLRKLQVRARRVARPRLLLLRRALARDPGALRADAGL